MTHHAGTRVLSASLCVIVLLAVASLAVAPLAAQVRDVTCYRRVDLANRLELFILENHVVPFAREKQAADKAGFAVITRENAFWWVGN